MPSQKMQDAPTSLNPALSECIINREDPNQAGAQEALQSVIPAPEDADDRDWRARTELPPPEVPRPAPRCPNWSQLRLLARVAGLASEFLGSDCMLF